MPENYLYSCEQMGGLVTANRQLLLVMVLVSVMGSGCAEMIRVNEARRLIAPTVPTSHPIGLNPPVFALQQGSSVGGHAINPSRIYHLEHRWKDTFEIDANEFNSVLRDELRSHGYRFAVGRRAHYQLNGTVTKLVFNLFGTDPRAGWSEAGVTVRWEIDGPQALTFVTRGSAISRQHSMASLFAAFRVSLRNLLANPRIVAALAPPRIAARPRPSKPTSDPVARPIPTINPAPSKTIVITPPSVSGTTLASHELVKLARRSAATVLVGDKWGSGTVISEQGHVVTNAHVVKGASNIVVITSDGVEHGARILRVNKDRNLALLSCAGAGFVPTYLRSSRVALGESVAAFGTPFHPALSHSVSRGRVLSREAQQARTDIRVSAGNAGGPVVDARGRSVGVVLWPPGSAAPTQRADLVTSTEIFRVLDIRYR